MEDVLNESKQFNMLKTAMNNISSGFCMFSCHRADYQREIAKGLMNKTHKLISYVDCSYWAMNSERSVSDFLNWICEFTQYSEVIILINIQVLGILYGEDDFIAKLNSSRDRLWNLNQLIIMGMTPYFKINMEIKAPDLISCTLDIADFHFGKVRDYGGEIDVDGFDNEEYVQVNRDISKVEKVLDTEYEYLDRYSQSELFEILESWYKERRYFSLNYDKEIKRMIGVICSRMITEEKLFRNKSVYTLVIRSLVAIKEYDRALELIEMMLYSMQSVFSEDSKDISDEYYNYGWVLFVQKDYGKARDKLDKAWNYYLKNSDVDSIQALMVRKLLAMIQTRLGNDNAEKEYISIINVVDEKYSPGVECYNTKVALAVHYLTFEKYEKAIELLEEISEKQARPGIKGIYERMIGLRLLALAYKDYGLYWRALECCDEAIAEARLHADMLMKASIGRSLIKIRSDVNKKIRSIEKTTK